MLDYQVEKGDAAGLLRKWVQRGYCSYDAANDHYVKSPQFLAKHPQTTE